jgi:hypothetical protein
VKHSSYQGTSSSPSQTRHCPVGGDKPRQREEFAVTALVNVCCEHVVLAQWDRLLFKNTDKPDRGGPILMSMAVNWIELAQKMAQAARAGVAIERKRLREILAELQRKQSPAQSSSRSQ